MNYYGCKTEKNQYHKHFLSAGRCTTGFEELIECHKEGNHHINGRPRQHHTPVQRCIKPNVLEI